jgi:hypothetical protein
VTIQAIGAAGRARLAVLSAAALAGAALPAMGLLAGTASAAATHAAAPAVPIPPPEATRLTDVRAIEVGEEGLQASALLTVADDPAASPASLGLASLGSDAGLLAPSQVASGAPISGVTVTFSAGRFTLCAATTDSDGVATCTDSGALKVLETRGLKKVLAVFAGDISDSGSRGSGPILRYEI